MLLRFWNCTNFNNCKYRRKDYINRKFSESTSGLGSARGEIIRVGNVSTGKSQAGMVYGIDGVFPTVCACTHGYAIGYILVEK